MLEIPTAFYSEGKQLVGIRHHPEKRTEKALILCHGYTGNKAENKRLFVEMARAVAREGVMAFRFDFYGSGDSEGEFVETRIATNISNLKSAFALVHEMGFQRIGVLGISMGAATAVLACSEGLTPDVLVLWSTVPDFRSLFESRAGSNLESMQKETYEYDGWLVHRDFVLEAVRYDVASALTKLPMPKLIVQGSADDPLFVAGFKQFQELGLSQTDFVLIDGAGHTYQTVLHRRGVISVTLDWLKKRL